MVILRQNFTINYYMDNDGRWHAIQYLHNCFLFVIWTH